MPLFRRKTAPVPLPDPQPQQHWVAYMYAPQPTPMPSMYAPQTGPYVQHPSFHVPPNTKYGHMGLQYRTIVPTTMALKGAPVQYVYQKSSTSYSDSPQHATIHRSYTGSQPTAPVSRGAEASRYPFPYAGDEYDVEIQTQPAKQGVFSAFLNLARGRSKSRGRGEAEPTSRPRSRGGFVVDGHDRERGRAKDPRYVDAHRERRLSGDKELKKVKYDSQQSFEKTMRETLEKSLREEPLQQEDRYRVPASMHRPSTKEDLKRKYEAEDRLRQQQEAAEEYERSQAVPIPNMRPSSRNRAASPDGLAESPTTLEHTKLNSVQLSGRPVLLHRPNTHSGYHTDAPPKAARRSSAPMHLQMQRFDLASPMEKSAPALKVPEGFFNQRGDQLMNSKGDVLRRPPHLEYPSEFAGYPPPGTGWQDHKGQVSYLLMIPSILLTQFYSLLGRTSDGSGRLAKGRCSLANPPNPRRY